MSSILKLGMVMATIGAICAQNSTSFRASSNWNKKGQVIPKGCKEYYFGDYSCIASSDKKADEKYKKFKSKV